MIEVINWASFQSYKDRKPPWVRLHRTLLDNFEFQQMSADARALLPMLWLLASEDIDPTSGCIRYSFEKIAFRLRLNTETVVRAIYEIRDAGFILLNQSCIEQDAPTDGVVYFMLDQQKENLKIGFSTQLEWRKVRLERDHGKLTVLFYIDGSKKLEKEYHEKFKHLAAEKNEWFRYVTDLEHFCNEVVTNKLRINQKFVTPETETETETETEKEEAGRVASKNTKRPAAKKTDADLLEEIRNNPAYEGIDIDLEIAKMQTWCNANNRVATPRRLINWLNRIDRPLQVVQQPAGPRTFDQIKMDNIKQAMAEFAGGDYDGTGQASLCPADGGNGRSIQPGHAKRNNGGLLQAPD